MLNYNIRKIIINKIALIQYREKVKMINQEYSKKYVLSFIISLTKKKSLCLYCIDMSCGIRPHLTCNYRELKNEFFSRINKLHGNAYGIIKLPNRYCYSSGMNCPLGYKN